MTDAAQPLAMEIAGVCMKSPLVLASGILGITSACMARVARLGAGAVTTKSFSLEPREGHKNPCVVPFEHGMINAVGLANPGIRQMSQEIVEFKNISGTPIIASVFGGTVEEFGEAVESVIEAKPDIIELNVSCPNVSSEFGRPFGADFDATASVTRLAIEKAHGIPISVKLTLNCPSIGQMARVCEENGANAITAINTVGPGMLIDVNTQIPVLSNLVGGVSGPGILPLAVRAVWDIYKAVSIPIIGIGGVVKAENVIQLVLAGATAVGIGSGIYFRGLGVIEEINRELLEFLESHGLSSVTELRGKAHGYSRLGGSSLPIPLSAEVKSEEGNSRAKPQRTQREKNTKGRN